MSPACIPVTFDPTVVTTEPNSGTRPFSRRCSASGSSTTRKPSTFALIQPGRSTTATWPVSCAPVSPVTRWTGSATTADSSRSSVTTARASDRPTGGPGRTNLTPVEMATSQSIICPLLTPPRYVPAEAAWSAAATPGERGGHRIDRVRRVGELFGVEFVRHEGEYKQVPAGVVDEPGQARHLGQVAGLGPHDSQRGGPEAAEHAPAGRQRP